MYIFGASLSEALDKAKGKTDKALQANRNRIIQKWIPEAAGNARNPKQFRDPATAVSF